MDSGDFRLTDSAKQLAWRLSPREQEVLELVCHGETNKGIARKLGCRVCTVRAHLEHARSKLGVRTRTEAAVAWANYLQYLIFEAGGSVHDDASDERMREVG